MDVRADAETIRAAIKHPGWHSTDGIEALDRVRSYVSTLERGNEELNALVVKLQDEAEDQRTRANTLERESNKWKAHYERLAGSEAARRA
jgi:hypothetical protein